MLKLWSLPMVLSKIWQKWGSLSNNQTKMIILPVQVMMMLSMEMVVMTQFPEEMETISSSEAKGMIL